jgi:hypothetical protein
MLNRHGIFCFEATLILKVECGGAAWPQADVARRHNTVSQAAAVVGPTPF